MKRIRITEVNVDETCVVHLTEPVTDGAPKQESHRCRRCGESIVITDLPHTHECSAPAKMEEPK